MNTEGAVELSALKRVVPGETQWVGWVLRGILETCRDSRMFHRWQRAS